MPEPITVEVDEQGNIGTLPAALQSVLDREITRAYKKAEQKYAERIINPAEQERLKQVEADNALLKEEIATRDKNFEEAARLREERFQKALADADTRAKSFQTEIERREARLKHMLGAEIRAAAVAAGARDESLSELSKLLGADVDLDGDLNPVVKDAQGEPRVSDGKPVTIEGLVKEYLAAHPHHLKGGRSTSGRAQGGVAMNRAMGQVADAHEEAFAAVAENPTVRTVGNAIRSMRQRAGVR